MLILGRLLALWLLLSPSIARADALVGNLPPAASPMSPFSCMYIAQAASSDKSICAGSTLGSTLAAYFGAIAASNNGSDFQSPSQTLTNLGGAPLASPNFTGVPLAPTASQSTTGQQLATLAYVKSQQSSPPTVSWLSGSNPSGGVLVASVRQPQNIAALMCRISAIDQATAVLSVYKAPSGTACPGSGTVLHSGSCNLAGSVNSDQPMALTVTTLNQGDTVCVGTANLASTPTSAGAVSMYTTPQ